jgi:hypothetical protein
VSFQLPYASRLDSLSQCLNYWLGPSYMGLLSSAISITTATTLANVTAAEATFTGYARYPMSGWTTPVINGAGAGSTTATGLFVGSASGGTGNIYGYFLTSSSGGFFYGVEVFAGGPVSAPMGVQLAIALTYTDQSQYGP